MTSLEGVVVSGLGRGAGFMAIPWVREAALRLLGFDPYPGTLNLALVSPDAVAAWRALEAGPSLRLAPPPPETCGARLYRVTLAAVDAAVIVPDVTDPARWRPRGAAPEPSDPPVVTIEVIAPVHLRSQLGLGDDDRVTVHPRRNPL